MILKPCHSFLGSPITERVIAITSLSVWVSVQNHKFQVKGTVILNTGYLELLISPLLHFSTLLIHVYDKIVLQIRRGRKN